MKYKNEMIIKLKKRYPELKHQQDMLIWYNWYDSFIVCFWRLQYAVKDLIKSIRKKK